MTLADSGVEVDSISTRAGGEEQRGADREQGQVDPCHPSQPWPRGQEQEGPGPGP